MRNVIRGRERRTPDGGAREHFIEGARSLLVELA
jgi:hypothetical protein